MYTSPPERTPRQRLMADLGYGLRGLYLVVPVWAACWLLIALTEAH